jgi:broad specificity phosphatase PhoE
MPEDSSLSEGTQAAQLLRDAPRGIARQQLAAAPMGVYLIRHGETAWNSSGRWQGALPVPLNDIGREQARKLGLYLASAEIAFDAIYSSDLPRAYETAAIVADILDKAPRTDERWRELDIGVFQGLTRQEIEERSPDAFAQFLADPLEYVIPGGESRRQLQERAYAALCDLAAITSSSRIAVVTHGGTVKMLLLRLFGQNRADVEGQEISNTSLTILERASGKWRVAAIGRTPHLSGMQKSQTQDAVYY